MRMSWRKQPNETGLRAVGQGPRGAILKVDGEDVGRVYPRRRAGAWEYRGWYWTARSDRLGIALRNTAGDEVETIEEAKAQCAAYVREALANRTT